jgi:hypothetical protein
MTALDRVSTLRRRSVAAPAAPATGGPPPELVARRDELSRRFAELQWDLGGLAYEMASRDHFRLDVIVRRAAELQQVDAELGEVERLLRLEDAGATGTCSSCGALHSRGAVFCWQCGTNLMERVPLAAVAPPAGGAVRRAAVRPAAPPPPPADAKLASLSTPPPPPPPPPPTERLPTDPDSAAGER